MNITFDPAKRDATLKDRGLDFADAHKVIGAADAVTVRDDRFDYGEDRLITAAELDGRIVVVVWIQRDDGIRVISMRHCHEREEARWKARMGRSG